MLSRLTITLMLLMVATLAVQCAAPGQHISQSIDKQASPLLGQQKETYSSKVYLVEKGRGIELCDLYYRNLSLFNPVDIACQRRFDPEFSMFTKPTWEKWDLNEHRSVAIKIKKLLHYTDQSCSVPDLDDPKIMEMDLSRDSPYFLQDSAMLSRIDIDNDGKMETVVLYSEGRCMDMHVFSKPLVVLNDARTLVDVEQTSLLAQNPSSGTALYSRMASHDYNLYDVFFYKGRVLFDRWSGDGYFCNDYLSVFEISNHTTREICSYKVSLSCK